jgi:hypothetical protein
VIHVTMSTETPNLPPGVGVPSEAS